MAKWVMLIYKVPREPSATRVYVWRKLKQLNAVSLQDAVWILPSTPRTREQFQWLAAEVSELEGEATFWESDLLYATDEDSLVREFTEPVEAEYKKILTALRKARLDLPELSQRFKLVRRRYYFLSPLGNEVRRALLSPTRGKRT